MRGPERVPGQPLPQRWLLHEQGQHREIQVRMHRWILRGQLRAHAGGTDPEAQHGGPCRHSSLLTNHSK